MLKLITWSYFLEKYTLRMENAKQALGFEVFSLYFMIHKLWKIKSDGKNTYQFNLNYIIFLTQILIRKWEKPHLI